MENVFSKEYKKVAKKAWGHVLIDYSSKDWTAKEIKPPLSIYNKESSLVKFKTVRAEIKIQTDPRTAIDYISNPFNMPNWDQLINDCYIVKRITN